MSSAPIFRYPGKDADVTWDQRLCIHIGECGRAREIGRASCRERV